MSSFPDHAPRLERAFTLEPEETSYTIDQVEGTVPPALRGTYYLNGPSRFRRGEVSYRHWLDGDGMVQSLRFTEDGVIYTRRFVESAKHTAETEAGRALYRTFGTAFPGDQLLRGIALASPVNVSVHKVGEKLLAFGEQGLPWELDPETLETLGEHTFGGRLNAISPFSAHPHFDRGGEEFFNFGISFSARQPMAHLYRFKIDGEVVYRRRIPIEHPASVHDFMVGERHIVLYISPYLLDMAAFAESGASLSEALRWEPERGSRLLVASRETGEKLGTIEIEPRYCLHLIGSFEDAGHLVLDVLELDRPIYDQYSVPELFTAVRRAQPVRYVIDPDRLEVVERRGLDFHLMCDFPATDPRRWQSDYNDFWVLAIGATEHPGRKFFDRLVHCSWSRGGADDVWQAPPRRYLGGEPIFLPHGDDGSAGTVICQIFDADATKSAFLLFDPYAVAAGPIAELKLTSPTPLGFHASWAAS